MAEHSTIVVLVTGMSGAGKSQALNTLEDCGFEAIDNLPLSVLPVLLGAHRMENRRLAVGMDIRTRDFSMPRFEQVIRPLAEHESTRLEVVFLDAEDAALVKRYKETRRLHPLAGDRPLEDGIRHERRLVSPLRHMADVVLDTTGFTSADLQREIKARFCHDPQQLRVFVTSFAFRHGLPREADLVLDVRFLKNPHYDEALRPHDGRHPEVAAHVQQDPDYAVFVQRLREWLLPLLPRYRQEGKHHLTIAVGCTGGKHRSVHMAQVLGEMIEQHGFEVSVRHRELVRGTT